MPRHEPRVRPGGFGPLDHVDAYVDDLGQVFFPGDEGYVEPESAQAEDTSEADPADTPLEKEGANVDPTAGGVSDAPSPLEAASRIDD